MTFCYPSDEYEDGGPLAAANSSPSTLREVLADQTMSIDAKRALLASWASDRRAVENWPVLRRLDSGSELHIDDIFDALKALDSFDPTAMAMPKGHAALDAVASCASAGASSPSVVFAG